MPTPAPDDVLAALRDFVARVDAPEPDAPPVGELVVRLGGQDARVTLRAPVARALVEALRTYHDPRDRGRCDHCGGRLDENFLCQSCGRPHGLFGQMLAERAARHAEPRAIPPEHGPRGSHSRDEH